MRKTGRLMARGGAALGIAAFFLPQYEVGGKGYSACDLYLDLSTRMEYGDFLCHALWLFAPVLVCLLIFSGSSPSGFPGPLYRGATLVVLLAAAFAMATQGSIVMSSARITPGVGAPSFALAVLLFVTPLLLGTVAIARILGRAEAEVTGAIARSSLGLLLFLNSLYLCNFWWDLFSVWVGSPTAGRILFGAFMAPAGGLLIACGELLRVPRSEERAPQPTAGGA